jgi:hypothetical protein
MHICCGASELEASERSRRLNPLLAKLTWQNSGKTRKKFGKIKVGEVV